MSNAVQSWWSLLCTVSVLNVLAWLLSAAVVEQRRAVLGAEAHTMRRLQILLSAGYVFGCAFRSMLPLYDVPRLCLADTWLSSVAVGRSVATFAELCFAAQWALLLRALAQATGSGFGQRVATLLLPLIAIAEVFSWSSVLTRSNLGHVVEETLWGLCAAGVVASLLAIRPRCERAWRPLLTACAAAGTVYVGYMFLVDVPMYWSRWVADEAAGRAYLGFAQGLVDATQRCVVSHRWEDWKSEVVWMSLYFSVAVWLSIALVHAPAPAARTPAARGRSALLAA